MGWIRRVLKKGNTSVEGDTLEIKNVPYISATGATATFSAVADGDGTIENRRYVWCPASIDLSASTATVVGPVMPVAAQIAKAYYVVEEAIGAGENTTKLQIGVVDADGSSNADADAHVLGTTDAANGLVTAAAAVGTVVDLTLGGTGAGAIAAGKCITVTHTQDADLDGKLKVVVEYYL